MGLFRKKSSLINSVAQADAAKKVNPLDLSSDQDLSIALMNMIAIEEICPSAPPQLVQMVSDMRRELMGRIIDRPAPKDAIFWETATWLLSQSMRMMIDGWVCQGDGDNAGAYTAFDGAYEMYSMFWGLNMGLIDLEDIEKMPKKCNL